LACATGGGPDLNFQPPTHANFIENVPFYPQPSGQCGPESLAAVLNFYGADLNPDRIAQAVYREDLRGAVGLDMVLYARNQGYEAGFFRGTLKDIIQAVDRGRPLIIMVDYGASRLVKSHYLVVIGYSPEGIMVNSDRTQGRIIPWPQLLPRWARTDHWTLLIEPPSRPSRPEE